MVLCRKFLLASIDFADVLNICTNHVAHTIYLVFFDRIPISTVSSTKGACNIFLMNVLQFNFKTMSFFVLIVDNIKVGKDAKCSRAFRKWQCLQCEL